MSLIQQVEKSNDQFIEWRRYIHRHPELGFKEFKTTQYIKEKLESWGIETRPNGDSTGVIGELRGEKKGNITVALRADIDALPVKEATGLDFSSENEGVTHACGHDIHTATLLGTAYILAQYYKKDLAGTVRFIFQPAEEELGGAKAVIANGGLENVDYILGAHTWPEIEGGCIGIRKGPMMGASDYFKVTIMGKGGHAAHPEKCIDPVVIGAYIVTELQTIISRRIAPLDSAVITIGHLTAGATYNVIPSECILEGSVRSQKPDIRKNLSVWIKDIAEHTALAMGAKAEVEYRFGVPPTVNNDELVDVVSETVNELLGPKKLVILPQPSMGSEDFSYYLERVPGAFFRLGTADERPASRYAQHNPSILFSEKSIPVGVVTFIGAVFKLTGSDMKVLK